MTREDTAQSVEKAARELWAQIASQDKAVVMMTENDPLLRGLRRGAFEHRILELAIAVGGAAIRGPFVPLEAPREAMLGYLEQHLTAAQSAVIRAADPSELIPVFICNGDQRGVVFVSVLEDD